MGFSALLAACASSNYPTTSSVYPSYPSPTYPSASYPTHPSAPVAAVEYGRITNLEYVPAGTVSNNRPNVMGAVVGGVVGAVLGNQVGGGSGRDVATVLGGVAGAAVGSQVGRNTTTEPVGAAYRITVQTDTGAWRTYEVGAPGDLRVGDRVRVENGVIFRV